MFGRYTNVWQGIGLGLVLWLVMMVIYSPIIGWGAFGLNPIDLAPDQPLYLGSPIQYVIATFVLYLIYGGLVAWLNPHPSLWTGRRPKPR